MPNIPGTNVAAPIVPFNTADTFPSHEAFYGLGGWREVADYTARDAVTVDRQSVGMIVFVQSDSSVWQLTVIGMPPTYVEFTTGGSAPSDVTLTAGVNINAYSAVTIHSDGNAYPADAATASVAGGVVGVAITSASTGNPFTCRMVGEVDNVGFGFTPGTQIYLGLSGALVGSVPITAAFQQPMGFAVSSSRLLLNIGLPVVLA